MTKKEKFLVYILIFISFLLKEKIYSFLYQKEIWNSQTEQIIKLKNQEIENKYQEILNAYHYQDIISYNIEESKVLYRDIYHLKDEITIYKGLENGIQEKNLVVNEKGLVGIINKVNKNSSSVELLTNKNTNISVKIGNSYGILKYQDSLIVEGINNKENINENAEVKTSDLSIYPENVLIGKVESVVNDNNGIEQIIKVTPAVDFQNIKYLTIITDLRGAP